jgi:hypothetical protein
MPPRPVPVDDATQAKLDQLVAKCRKYSGEYVAGGNPSCATQYSNKFVVAAREICRLYKGYGVKDLEWALYRLFHAERIQSCRGGVMEYDKNEYFFNKYIKRFV